MKYSITPLEPGKNKIHAELSRDDVHEYAREAEKALARTMKVQGFRKGKAPHSVTHTAISPELIKQEALSLAVQTTLHEIIKKEKCDVIQQSDFSIVKNDDDGLTFDINVLCFPSIELGVYKGLTIRKNAVVVSEQEIQSVLDDIAQSRKDIHEVQRPARQGDVVEVDFTLKDDNGVIDGGTSRDHVITIGDKTFITGFEDNLIGMQSGERKQFSLAIPDDYYQKSIAGKQLQCDVTLKKISESELPAIDDAFAQSVGQFSSLGQLQQSIRDGLTLEKENKETQRMRLELLNAIVNTSTVTVPDYMIDERLDRMIEAFDNDLHRNRMELSLYLAHIKKTQDELRNEWREKAKNQVAMALISHAIGKEENITVDDAEVQAELQNVLQNYISQSGIQAQEMLNKVDIVKMQQQIKDSMMSEKVFEFLEKETHIKQDA